MILTTSGRCEFWGNRHSRRKPAKLRKHESLVTKNHQQGTECTFIHRQANMLLGEGALIQQCSARPELPLGWVWLGYTHASEEGESLVGMKTMNRSTEYTEPIYRYCNSGNLLQWTEGVERERRWEIGLQRWHRKETLASPHCCINTHTHLGLH